MHNSYFIHHCCTSQWWCFYQKTYSKFFYCVLTALICEKITFCKCDYRYQDILDNQDNFVVNIEIFLNALFHTSNVNAS